MRHQTRQVVASSVNSVPGGMPAGGITLQLPLRAQAMVGCKCAGPCIEAINISQI